MRMQVLEYLNAGYPALWIKDWDRIVKELRLCPKGNLHQHNREYTVLPFPYQIDQTSGSINTNVIDQAEEAKRSAYQTQAKNWLFHVRILQNYREVFSEARNIAEKIVKLVDEVKVLKAKNSGDPEEWQGYDKNRFNSIVTEVKEQEQQYQRLVDWYNQNAKGYDKSLFVNKHLPYELPSDYTKLQAF